MKLKSFQKSTSLKEKKSFVIFIKEEQQLNNETINFSGTERNKQFKSKRKNTIQAETKR